jgi:hypothetical protein
MVFKDSYIKSQTTSWSLVCIVGFVVSFCTVFSYTDSLPIVPLVIGLGIIVVFQLRAGYYLEVTDEAVVVHSMFFLWRVHVYPLDEIERTIVNEDTIYSHTTLRIFIFLRGKRKVYHLGYTSRAWKLLIQNKIGK